MVPTVLLDFGVWVGQLYFVRKIMRLARGNAMIEVLESEGCL